MPRQQHSYRESRTNAAKAAKDQCNACLAKFTLEHLLPTPRPLRALALDGLSMRTTRTLLRHDLPLRNIVIPQWHKATATLMRKRAPAIARIHHCSMNALLQRPTIIARHSIDIAFFDFMGSPTGCKASNHYPMNDLQLFLRNKCAPRAVLAFTFSARGNRSTSSSPHHRSKGRKTMHQHILQTFLRPVLHANGYRITSTTGFTYKRSPRSAPMAFWALATYKNVVRVN